MGVSGIHVAVSVAALGSCQRKHSFFILALLYAQPAEVTTRFRSLVRTRPWMQIWGIIVAINLWPPIGVALYPARTAEAGWAIQWEANGSSPAVKQASAVSGGAKLSQAASGPLLESVGTPARLEAFASGELWASTRTGSQLSASRSTNLSESRAFKLSTATSIPDSGLDSGEGAAVPRHVTGRAPLEPVAEQQKTVTSAEKAASESGIPVPDRTFSGPDVVIDVPSSAYLLLEPFLCVSRGRLWWQTCLSRLCS